MCKDSLFIPKSVKSKHSFLFYFKIAKELSEFRNYLEKLTFSNGLNHMLSLFMISIHSLIASSVS